MTATPHNGKEEDFQLFMALLDGDRFEGNFRDGVHAADVSDLMRRMVKENLLKFDGTPLFPERIAYTVPYKLSEQRRSSTRKSRNTCARSSTARTRSQMTSAPAPSVCADHPPTPSRVFARGDLPVAAPPPRTAGKAAARAGDCCNAGRRPSLAAAVPTLDDDDVEDLEEAPDNEVEAPRKRSSIRPLLRRPSPS